MSCLADFVATVLVLVVSIVHRSMLFDVILQLLVCVKIYVFLKFIEAECGSSYINI